MSPHQHNVMRFLGACNEADRAMRACLRKEVCLFSFFCTFWIRHNKSSDCWPFDLFFFFSHSSTFSLFPYNSTEGGKSGPQSAACTRHEKETERRTQGAALKDTLVQYCRSQRKLKVLGYWYIELIMTLCKRPLLQVYVKTEERL